MCHGGGKKVRPNSTATKRHKRCKPPKPVAGALRWPKASAPHAFAAGAPSILDSRLDSCLAVWPQQIAERVARPAEELAQASAAIPKCEIDMLGPSGVAQVLSDLGRAEAAARRVHLAFRQLPEDMERGAAAGDAVLAAFAARREAGRPAT